MLCDCPGLVMQSFVSTKHEMVIWGILPIDQMRDHVGPVNLIASFVPRPILESTYGIFIPKPVEGEDPTRPPTSEELLNAYGCIVQTYVLKRVQVILNRNFIDIL